MRFIFGHLKRASGTGLVSSATQDLLDVRLFVHIDEILSPIIFGKSLPLCSMR